MGNIKMDLFNIVCTVNHIAVCRRTKETYKSSQIMSIFPVFLLALHVSDEALVHHQEHCLLSGDIDWIELAEDRDRWRALVNAVMNFHVA